MSGFGALGQYPLGGGPHGTTSITIIGWFAPLTEPVRFRRDPKANLALEHQTLAFQPAPSPFVATGWYNWLSEPKRFKLGELPPYQQFITFYPTPSPFVAAGWYNWLSEPVRIKPSLKSPLHPFETQAAFFPPFPDTLLEGWFNWYSEPVRFKKGLSATLQQALAYHPRLLPNPNITARMSAFEINTDSAIFAVYVIQSLPAATAQVSITETSGGNSATSVQEPNQ